MFREPCSDLWMLVRSVVVYDEMQVQILRCLPIDLLQKFQELLVTVPRHALPDDFSFEYVQCGEECGRAIAFVVVRHCLRVSSHKRKRWLCTIKSLNLTFLVHAQHKSVIGRIQVQADNVCELLHKMLVTGKFERLLAVRLDIVRLPDALNRHFGESQSFRQHTIAPVRGGGRLLMERHIDHLLHRRRRQLRLPSRSRFVSECVYPSCTETFSPEDDCLPVHRQFLRDGIVGFSLGSEEHDG